MDFFLEDPDQICRSLNICKTQNCVKLHPRFLSGACIKFLNLTYKNKGYKKKKCMEEECDLNHFSIKELRKQIQQQPINGVLQFNLCPQAEKCVNPDCQNFDGLEIVESQQDKIPDLITFSLMSSYQSSKVNSDIFEKKRKYNKNISQIHLCNKSQGRRTQTDQSNSSISNVNSETLTQLQNCGELKDVSQTDIIQLPNFDSQEVNCVCDICGSIFQIELAEYRNQKEELFLCDDCSSLKKEAACECCGCIFHYYLQSLIKSGQHPSKCQECIQYCNENIKTVCFYCEKNCLRKKIKKMETDKCELLLCEDAQNYLLSLKCQYCKSLYQFKNILSLKEYMSGFYACKSCFKNDKLKQ